MSSVTSHTTTKEDPPRPESMDDATYKRMMLGYVFDRGYPEKTPLDYLDGGPNRKKKTDVWGIQIITLERGINNTTLPPVEIWERGRWLEEIDSMLPYDMSEALDEDELLSTWVVDGQGTPGAYKYRMYVCPKAVTTYATPKHPMMWKAKEKKGNAPLGRFFSTRTCRLKPGFTRPEEDKPKPGSYGFNGGHTGYTPKPASAPPAVKASLPAGVRFQCPSCGHWFMESTLAPHAKVCPGTQGTDGQNGWGLMCDKECGCEYIEGFPTEQHYVGHKTLDHVSRCKPGFIPTKKEVKVETIEPKEGEEPKEDGEEMETISEKTDSTEAKTPQTEEA